jgi:hypothetical protein
MFINYRADLRRRKKDLLVAYKGGKCTDCSGVFPGCVYHFDHRDPSAKSFELSEHKDLSLSKLRSEVSKCDLVCANCHAIRTANSPAVSEKRNNALRISVRARTSVLNQAA